LQNFSANWKSLSQEEEIAGWKQSLDVSESGAESPQHGNGSANSCNMEDDFKQLEAQRQEIETGQAGAAANEIEQTELQGAWEHRVSSVAWGATNRVPAVNSVG